MSKKKRTPHDPSRPVGYKNPSKETQFKPGNPGGPGRPKGATDAEGILAKMIRTKVPVTENGRRVKKTMADAMAKRGQQLALTGSPAAFFRALELFDKYGVKDKPAEIKKPLGDISVLGEGLLRLFLAVLEKTIAYREVKPGEPVQPLSQESADAVVGRWELSIGEDGHVEAKRFD